MRWGGGGGGGLEGGVRVLCEVVGGEESARQGRVKVESRTRWGKGIRELGEAAGGGGGGGGGVDMEERRWRTCCIVLGLALHERKERGKSEAGKGKI